MTFFHQSECRTLRRHVTAAARQFEKGASRCPFHALRSVDENDQHRCSRQLYCDNPRAGYGRSRTMKNPEAFHRSIVQLIRWLAPASRLLCQRQHTGTRAICADCEAAFSRNQHACHHCALPLGPPMHRRSIDWALRVVQRRGCVRPASRIHLTFSAHTRPTSCAPV